MTKRKRPKKNATDSQVRVVYEVTLDGQVRRVEASTVHELRDQLYGLLRDLDAYALAAIARLVTEERATVSTKTWGVKRVGVLQFTADDESMPLKKRSRAPLKTAPVPASEGPTAVQHPAPIFAGLEESDPL